jgi:hypothetical protein
MMLFTHEEAQAKLAQLVRTHVAFVGVPVGTRGTVVRVEQTPEGCCVVIQWDLLLALLRHCGPHENWFSRALYDRCLVEEPPPLLPTPASE